MSSLSNMQIATKGLVLHTTKYSETSIIAKVFTRQLGVRSYIIKGVRSAHSRTKQNLLQPLSYLDMVVYNSSKSQLNYIKEMRPEQVWNSIPMHPVKSSLLFFMNELLYKTLHEEEPNPEIFDYVVATLMEIDANENDNMQHLPIHFLLHLSLLLGIAPLDNFSHHESLFDLQEGRYVAHATESTLSTEPSRLFHEYLADHLVTNRSVPLSQRTTIINAMVTYYQLHLTGFRDFQSHEILHSLLQ